MGPGPYHLRSVGHERCFSKIGGPHKLSSLKFRGVAYLVSTGDKKILSSVADRLSPVTPR